MPQCLAKKHRVAHQEWECPQAALAVDLLVPHPDRPEWVDRPDRPEWVAHLALDRQWVVRHGR